MRKTVTGLIKTAPHPPCPLLVYFYQKVIHRHSWAEKKKIEKNLKGKLQYITHKCIFI